MFSKMVSKQEKTSGLKLSVIAVEKKSELKDVFATVFVNRILTKPRQRFGDSKRNLRSSQKKQKANKPSSEEITIGEKLTWKEYIVHEYECEFY